MRRRHEASAPTMTLLYIGPLPPPPLLLPLLLLLLMLASLYPLNG